MKPTVCSSGKLDSYLSVFFYLLCLNCDNRSRDFRPAFDQIRDLRAFVPHGVPMLAATASVTEAMRDEIIKKLDMSGYHIVSVSPNKKNIFYEVLVRSTIDEDFDSVLTDLTVNNIKAKRVLVYCQSLNMCSAPYAQFLYTLGENSYYPSGAEQVSDNRLFGMYHSCTDEYNKRVITDSLSQSDGIVRVVFATMALGMGVDFRDVQYVIHYGAPRSLEDYLQESGRVGRNGQQSYSKVFWKPVDAPMRKDQSDHRNREIAAVRRFLEDSETCRRYMLLSHFDRVVADNMERPSRTLCCDNCRALGSAQ